MVAARNAAAVNDRANESCRTVQRCVAQPCRSRQRPPPQEMPQPRPAEKPPPKLTRKRPHLGVGSLGSRRVVENFHVRCAAGRHWPSQVASALWRRAAHRDCPPHDWPPVQSPFHLAAAAAPVLCLRSGASVVPSVAAISMPLLLLLMNKGRGGRRWPPAPLRPKVRHSKRNS